MDLTNYISVSSIPSVNGTVNQTTILADFETFAGYMEGDLVKFFSFVLFPSEDFAV